MVINDFNNFHLVRALHGLGKFVVIPLFTRGRSAKQGWRSSEIPGAPI